MKPRLTVSIEKDLVSQAQLAAHAIAQSGGSTFSQRWRGQFKPAERDALQAVNAPSFA